jgi:hypothetical protein
MPQVASRRTSRKKRSTTRKGINQDRENRRNIEKFIGALPTPETIVQVRNEVTPSDKRTLLQHSEGLSKMLEQTDQRETALNTQMQSLLAREQLVTSELLIKQQKVEEGEQKLYQRWQAVYAIEKQQAELEQQQKQAALQQHRQQREGTQKQHQLLWVQAQEAEARRQAALQIAESQLQRKANTQSQHLGILKQKERDLTQLSANQKVVRRDLHTEIIRMKSQISTIQSHIESIREQWQIQKDMKVPLEGGESEHIITRRKAEHQATSAMRQLVQQRLHLQDQLNTLLLELNASLDIS